MEKKEKIQQKIKEIEEEVMKLEETGRSVGFTKKASNRLNILYKQLEDLK